jgi:sugar phosphate isomerase/epimerase
MQLPVRIAAFPKCYLDAIVRDHTLFEWIELSRQLDVEGLELYEHFFTSLDDAYIDRVGEAIEQTGRVMPMLCCSPDFTNPDVNERERAVEREARMIRITRRLGGPRAACRVLSGQRYPDVSIEQGAEWVVSAIEQLLPVAREYDVILAMENHYKDGYWKYPEFAQKQDIFLRIVNAISDRDHFGVQYDPSNAIVAGEDPIALLYQVADRVVTMHASDRYVVAGATLDELRTSDGTIGYSPKLQHGVVGKGLNDYDAIFKILADAKFSDWVSIEDGMNGMDEMFESVNFLKRMREKYFSSVSVT